MYHLLGPLPSNKVLVCKFFGCACSSTYTSHLGRSFELAKLRGLQACYTLICLDLPEFTCIYLNLPGYTLNVFIFTCVCLYTHGIYLDLPVDPLIEKCHISDPRHKTTFQMFRFCFATATPVNWSTLLT